MRHRGYCENEPCGIGPVPLFTGLCRSCYQYLYRNGHQRPAELVMRSADRVTARLIWQQAHSRVS